MAQPPVTIAGYQVQFPYKPYGTQLGFMNQFLRCVDQQGNALLEAPTGSGKTACLLASALAWQRRHIEAAAAVRARNLGRSLNRARKGPPPGFGGGKDAAADSNGGGGDAASGKGGKGGDAAGSSASGNSEVDEPEDADEEVPKVPKIYYATRTHSQIAQVRACVCDCLGACAKFAGLCCRSPAWQLCSASTVPLQQQRQGTNMLHHPPRCQVIRELKRMNYSPRMAVLVRRRHHACRRMRAPRSWPHAAPHAHACSTASCTCMRVA